MATTRVQTLRVTLLLLVVLVALGCSGGGNDSSLTTTTPTPVTPTTTTALPTVTWYLAEDATLPVAQVSSFFDTQQLFFDIRSPNNATAEIRGGITPSAVSYQTDAGDPFAPNPANNPLTFAALLGGDQVRPRNVITKATAYGSVTLDPASKRITGFIVSSGIVGVSARIYEGLPGATGGIVVPLEGGPVVWTVPAATLLNDSQLARLSAGSFYFSINSATFPDGELRGQLNQRVRIADLKGSSEVPPVTTSARGAGFLAVNTSTRQFSGYVTVSGLSSPVRSAILHVGAEGINGTSAIILADSGNGVWSLPPNTVLSAAQVTNFNNTELYFNVRTQNNPGGELRGQLINPTIRIGTSILNTVTGAAVTTPPATGEGMLAWNSVTTQVSGSVKTDKLDGIAAVIQSGSATASGQDLLALTTNTPIMVTPTPGISYALDIQPLFTARCLGGACHSTGGFAPMSLESDVSYAFVRLLLVPGNSAASYLFQRLTVNSSSFPQMPLNRTPLDSTDLGLIKNWIDRGALNN